MRAAFCILFVLLISNVHASQSRPTIDPGDSPQRNASRAARLTLAYEYDTAHKAAGNARLHALDSTVRWLASVKAKTEGEAIVAEIRAADPHFVGLTQLDELLARIDNPVPLDESKRKELESRRKNAGRIEAGSLIDLASRCYRGGLLGFAYDLTWEVLDLDPDNVTARAAMVETKAGGVWRTPYEALALSRGYVYVPSAGWVPATEQKRIEAGEWNDNGKWMNIKDADELHSNAANPWKIETENFILKASTTRKQAVLVAERLEAIRELCFREYLDFFVRGSSAAAGELLFRRANPKKLVINYYGNKQQYDTAVNMLELPAGQRELLINSAGFYFTKTHQSNFYYEPNNGPFQFVVMQHEVTHQILGEYSGGGCEYTWLAEGVAEALEAATPNPAGRLLLPHGLDHPDVAGALDMLQHNHLPSITALLTMKHDAFHESGSRRTNYVTSGALCRFLLEYKNGSYAADFLEYLFDSYRSRAGISLSRYVSLPAEQIETEFHDYLMSFESDGAKLSSRSNSSDSSNPFERRE